MLGNKYRHAIRITRHTKLGFTIVELLVVIATLSIVFSLGSANFRGSQKRQELSNATLSIKQELRFTQELALAGRKPVGCDLLRGYKFKINSDNKTYNMYANCHVGTSINDIPYLATATDITKNYPSISSISSSADIIFLSLGRGVDSDVNITLTVIGTSGSQTITVTKGGEIN